MASSEIDPSSPNPPRASPNLLSLDAQLSPSAGSHIVAPPAKDLNLYQLDERLMVELSKEPKDNNPAKDFDKATVAAIPGRKKQRLVIGDAGEVNEFYTQRFREMPQTTCKVIAKAFVKLVEPKKQSSHPYTKGKDRAPKWWPNTEGPNGVIHKEPDHLLRGPRVVLIVHILKMVTGPRSKQCEAVQRQELTISKLKEVTMESMANWFNDKTIAQSSRDSKKAILKEVFKVAEIEERYLQGGIDSSTTVQVMPYSGDKTMLESSEEEGSGDELIKVENESRLSMVISAVPSDDMVSPPHGIDWTTFYTTDQAERVFDNISGDGID